MARRSVLLIVAVLIAALGTAMILLYVQGIDDRAAEGQELVEVLTATAVIETGETVTAAEHPSTREPPMDVTGERGDDCWPHLRLRTNRRIDHRRDQAERRRRCLW